MGEIIKKSKDFKSVSKKLFDFAKKSHKTITNFGGTTIYAGGDDLLFLAPLKKDYKTIFDLLFDISNIFDEEFKEENNNLNKKASVSFGLSISYYKFPLYEALEISRNLLYKAKKVSKNSIAFEVIKHSGQKFGDVVNKNETGIIETFTNLLKESNLNGSEADNFLGSLHHKLKIQENVIDNIGTCSIKLNNFFKNNFNEDEHKKYENFFKEIAKYIKSVYDSDNIIDKKALIYSTLRFIKFIKGDVKYD